MKVEKRDMRWKLRSFRLVTEKLVGPFTSLYHKLLPGTLLDTEEIIFHGVLVIRVERDHPCGHNL